MTRDDIINFMNWHPSIVDDAPGSLLSKVERIVRAAEQAEREACAQVCEAIGQEGKKWPDDRTATVRVAKSAIELLSDEYAAAIRARGQE